jgi:hypothetical protein
VTPHTSVAVYLNSSELLLNFYHIKRCHVWTKLIFIVPAMTTSDLKQQSYLCM